jgi:hypothetical protein
MSTTHTAGADTNTPTCPDPSHHPTADPWATRNQDGTITLHWPDDVAYALCSRELIEEMVKQHNRSVQRRTTPAPTP